LLNFFVGKNRISFVVSFHNCW